MKGSLTGEEPPVMKADARLYTWLKSKGVSKGLGNGDSPREARM